MDSKDIGLRQGRKLANMAYADRLQFIADGLPIIIGSARELVEAARGCANPRGRTILERQAAEEAAKALILIDMARCPSHLVASRVGPLMRWFYDHMARLLWADACYWCVAHLAELQGYLDRDRRSHYLDGPLGVDWIFPNEAIYDRESLLYADIASHEDGELYWSEPRAERTDAGMLLYAVSTAEALEKVGATGIAGLEILSRIWGSVVFDISERTPDNGALIHETLVALEASGLIAVDTTDDHIQALYRRWQMPMYLADFSPLPVDMDDIERDRRAALAAEMGY